MEMGGEASDSKKMSSRKGYTVALLPTMESTRSHNNIVTTTFTHAQFLSFNRLGIITVASKRCLHKICHY